MNVFEAIEAGIAPRIEAGWNAMAALLADDQWHTRTQLTFVAVQTGLSRKSAESILADALRTGRVVAQRPSVNRKYRLPLSI